MNKNNVYSRDLQKVGIILNKFVKNFGIDKRLKERVVVSLWPQMVGKAFSDCTKAVSVFRKQDHEVLLVAVSSSSITQELQFYKKDLIKRVVSLTSMLDFNIRDIIFSHKIWKETSESNENKDSDGEVFYVFKKSPTQIELDNIPIPDSIINNVRESIISQDFITDDQKQRFLNTVMKDIKTQIWKKNNGFPCCNRCGVPINFYNPKKEQLCPACLHGG